MCLLCEHARNVWGTRNSQTFVVDMFNYFYITSVARSGNHFIALNMAGDVVTGCVKSIMRSGADESRWIGEPVREFRSSYCNLTVWGRELFTAIFFAWTSLWISLPIIVANSFSNTKTCVVVVRELFYGCVWWIHRRLGQIFCINEAIRDLFFKEKLNSRDDAEISFWLRVMFKWK